MWQRAWAPPGSDSWNFPAPPSTHQDALPQPRSTPLHPAPPRLASRNRESFNLLNLQPAPRRKPQCRRLATRAQLASLPQRISLIEAQEMIHCIHETSVQSPPREIDQCNSTILDMKCPQPGGQPSAPPIQLPAIAALPVLFKIHFDIHGSSHGCDPFEKYIGMWIQVWVGRRRRWIVSVSVCGSADHSSISGRFRWQQSKLDGRSGATLPCLHANQRFNSIPLLLSAFLSFFLSFFLSVSLW